MSIPTDPPSRRVARSGGRSRRSLVALLGVALVVVTAFAPTAAAAETAAGPADAFVVALEEDGSARVTLRVVHDLDAPEERAAFESLANDTAARQAAATAFRDRLADVAAAAADRTGRPMSVSNPSVSVDTDGSVGVIELSVTWTGLAAVDGDRLRVDEPFASGYTPDDRFVIRAPDGYAVVESSHGPATVEDGVATWSPPTDLTGFDLVVGTDGAGGSAGSDGGEVVTTGQPGFGPAATLAALALAGVLLARRR